MTYLLNSSKVVIDETNRHVVFLKDDSLSKYCIVNNKIWNIIFEERDKDLIIVKYGITLKSVFGSNIVNNNTNYHNATLIRRDKDTWVVDVKRNYVWDE
jgi:hypothetical protein